MIPILIPNLLISYAVIHKLLKKSYEALKEANNNNNNYDKLTNLLSVENKKFIEDTINFIHNMGNAETVYKLIEDQNWNITVINATLNLANKLASTINTKNLSDIKKELLTLAENFEKSKHLLKIINNSYGKKMEESLKDIKGKEAELKLIQDLNEKAKKGINRIINLKFDTKLLKELIIININYFSTRREEAQIIYKKDGSILSYLITLIKQFSFKDESGNEITDNVFSVLSDSEKFQAKTSQLNPIIDKLKKLNENIIALNSAMPNNEKQFLKNEKINFKDEYFSELKSITDKIKDLKNLEMNDVNSLYEITNLVLFLVSQQKLSIFKKIIVVENKLITDFQKIKEIEVIAPDTALIAEIDKLIKYKIIDKKQFEEIKKKKVGEDLKNLTTMEKYVIKTVNYQEAKNKLKEANDKWKEFQKKPDAIFESKDVEEKKKELIKITEILRNLNMFNNSFFNKILEYTDFNSIDKNNIENNKCILSNEINKVKYYNDLLNALKKNNNSSTKLLEKKISELIKNRVLKIKDLKKYAKPFMENVKKNIYAVKELKISEFNSDDMEIIKEAIGRITNYFNNMKDIAKIVKDFRIKEEDLK
ncbi:MAG: hypothetical protein PHS81_04245 [Candidatus Nanoarchaeia archaeon]|nr:hypothetical protein [Candidatus Nanoarchaeia archaeon]